MMDESEKGIALFKDKKTGDIRASRHLRPDFVYGMPGNEIMKLYTVTIVYGDEAKKYLWGEK